MKRVNLEDVSWVEWTSPGGRFQGRGREISLALGAIPHAHLGKGGHPFELEFGRLAPGQTGCPFHRHLAQWEMFVFVAGNGMVRHGHEQRPVRAGDVALHPPGAPHQVTNTGVSDLDYLLLSDNPLLDAVHYPDSNKWGLLPAGGFFRPSYVDFWQGEEEAGGGRGNGTVVPALRRKPLSAD